jgi:hypothetical protein
VGLLCVKEKLEDRPNMSFVVQMLSSDCLLSKPKEPGFFTNSIEVNPSSSKHTTCYIVGSVVNIIKMRAKH